MPHIGANVKKKPFKLLFSLVLIIKDIIRDSMIEVNQLKKGIT